MEEKRKVDVIEVIGTTILISICVIFLIYLFTYISYLCVKKVNDAEKFLNGEYEKYNSGETAKQFFDNYVELEEYKDIAFHYCDGEKYIGGLHKTYTVFIVDIYYEEDVFYETAKKILPDTNDANKAEMRKYINNFDVGIITLDKELYRENTACVMFDLEYNTIRYAFIYKLPVETTNSRALAAIEWALPDLHWNSNESDWIFDSNQ